MKKPPEQEIIVADVDKLYQTLSSKTTELMINGVDFELEVVFEGAISGRLTARNSDEISAMMNLIQALSKAAIILPSVKSSVKITRKMGGG